MASDIMIIFAAFILGVIVGYYLKIIVDRLKRKAQGKISVDLFEAAQLIVGTFVLIIFLFVVQNSLTNQLPIPVDITALVGVVVGSLFGQPLVKNLRSGNKKNDE